MPKDEDKDSRETIIPPAKQPRSKGEKRKSPPVIDGRADEIGEKRESREEHKRAAEAAAAAAGIRMPGETDVAREDPPSATEPPPEAPRANDVPPEGKRPARAPYAAIAASALLGGLIGAGLLYLAAQFLPAQPNTEILARLEQQDQRLQALTADANRGEQLGERVDALERSAITFGEVSQRLSGIEERLATQNFEELSADVAELRRRMDEVSAGDGGALMEVAARIEAIDKRVAELETRIPKVAETVSNQAAQARASSRAAAVSNLRAAVEAGRPYASELKAVTDGAPAEDIAPLKRHAEAGVASIEALTRSLEGARETVLSSESAAAEAKSQSLMERVWSSAKSVVRITRSDEEGADATLDDMKARLAAGDVAGAVRLGEALPDAPRVALSSWLDQARARLEAIAALSRLEQSPPAEAAEPRQG